MLRVLSLGAGVQSTTVLLMSIYGELPPLDAAIFADTGWEPAAVYAHLVKLEALAELHGLPLKRVSYGDIHQDHADPQHPHLFVRNAVKVPRYQGTQRVFIPFYTKNGAKLGKTNRRCTAVYKVDQIEKEVRRMLGLRKGQRWPTDGVHVEQVIGISWDESERMRDPIRPAVTNVYPLVNLRMTRDDCHRWLADKGWQAPRSACIGCPFHSNDEWRRLRDEAPDEWAQAVTFDYRMRDLQSQGKLSFDGEVFLHRDCVPLDQANLEPAAGPAPELTLFGDECLGMCGV